MGLLQPRGRPDRSYGGGGRAVAPVADNMAKRVGILTGGGDVPGLNAAIQQFVWRMEDEGYEVLGLRRGWAALLNVKPYHAEDNSSWLVPLNKSNTRTIDRSGGTILHSSRINPALTKPEIVPDHL